MQIAQRNDTDSFRAMVGSIPGVYLRIEGLEERWLAPFNDDLRTELARFYERPLAGVAKRMGELPRRVVGEVAQIL